MYYQPVGKPHTPNTALYRFKPPKDRHHSMRMAHCDGGATYARAEDGLVGYVWTAYVTDTDQVVVRREDLSEEHVITTKAGITQLDFAFDQNMRPFVVYVADGLPYYYHFDPKDSTYGEVPLDPSIKFPRCSLDMIEDYYIPRSDIILAYTREGNLCIRLQRERFENEYIIATDPKKTMVWRIGRTIDGHFGYQWR